MYGGRRDDLSGELLAAFDIPAKAPIETICADPVAATQDAVLAGAALFGLIGRKILLGDRHEGVAVEPVDRRRHVAIDVDPFGDEFAFVVLTGERQQHAASIMLKSPAPKHFAVSRGQRMA